ncbi:helix-turn-helix domain-containing protein [Staphylococcus pseudintermedius]
MQSIEKHRKSLGYKQYEFAEMMGLTPVQYSKIKSGRRALYSLSKVFSS